MRKLIAAMKISLDGKFGNADGYADWAETWSEDYDLMPQIDACILGGRMYPGYEQYWTAIQNAPDQPLPMTGKMAAPAEIEWANFAKRTTHYVLSTTLESAQWPSTRFLRETKEVAALKQEPGKDIYLMGGGQAIGNLLDAGLLDELRLIVYPVISGGGKALFELTRRHQLELRKIQQLAGERVGLVYTVSG
jgi:dihydrofolate reductase